MDDIHGCKVLCEELGLYIRAQMNLNTVTVLMLCAYKVGTGLRKDKNQKENALRGDMGGSMCSANVSCFFSLFYGQCNESMFTPSVCGGGWWDLRAGNRSSFEETSRAASTDSEVEIEQFSIYGHPRQIFKSDESELFGK